MAGYKNYHAYWNEEYDENAVYITTDEKKARRIVEDTTATVEIYKKYYLLYSKN